MAESTSEEILTPGVRGLMNQKVKSRVAYNVRDLSVASFQVSLVPPDSAWSTNCVISITFSNDGVNFYTTDATETLSDEGMTPPIDVEAVAFAAVEVTTEGSDDVDVYTHAWGSR